MWFMTTDTFLEYRGIFSNPGTYSGLNRIWCYAIANLILWFDAIWAIYFQNVMFYVIWKGTDTMRLCLFDYIGRKQICVGNTCIRLWLHVPYSGFTLGQVMACRLSGAKGLLAPIMTHYLLNHWKQTSLKYESFLLSNMHLKRHLRNVGQSLDNPFFYQWWACPVTHICIAWWFFQTDRILRIPSLNQLIIIPGLS